MSEITMDEVLKLVSFRKAEDCWVIEDVFGTVTGSVKSDVLGNVCGSIVGSVYGDVECDVQGEVVGDVWCSVVGKVMENEEVER